jgi:hypothetical protein
MNPPSLKSAPRLAVVHILGLLAVGPLLGSAFGAMTNMLNGIVSPKFFADVMNVHDDLLRNSIRNGIMRGAMFGAVYGTVFVALLAWMTRLRCVPAVALRYVALTVLFAGVMWCLGGLLAVVCVSLLGGRSDPYWFGHHVSESSRLRYAWVRGSIFAVEQFGILAVLLSLGCFFLRYGRATKSKRKAES